MKIQYTVDIRYKESGLLRNVAGKFDTIEEANKHLKMIQSALYEHLYAEVSVVRE